MAKKNRANSGKPRGFENRIDPANDCSAVFDLSQDADLHIVTNQSGLLRRANLFERLRNLQSENSFENLNSPSIIGAGDFIFPFSRLNSFAEIQENA